LLAPSKVSRVPGTRGNHRLSTVVGSLKDPKGNVSVSVSVGTGVGVGSGVGVAVATGGADGPPRTDGEAAPGSGLLAVEQAAAMTVAIPTEKSPRIPQIRRIVRTLDRAGRNHAPPATASVPVL
jgi:hypothetical protein